MVALNIGTLIAVAIKYGPQAKRVLDAYGPLAAEIIEAVAPVLDKHVGDEPDPHARVNQALAGIGQKPMSRYQFAEIERQWMERSTSNVDGN